MSRAAADHFRPPYTRPSPESLTAVRANMIVQHLPVQVLPDPFEAEQEASAGPRYTIDIEEPRPAVTADVVSDPAAD